MANKKRVRIKKVKPKEEATTATKSVPAVAPRLTAEEIAMQSEAPVSARTAINTSEHGRQIQPAALTAMGVMQLRLEAQ